MSGARRPPRRFDGRWGPVPHSVAAGVVALGLLVAACGSDASTPSTVSSSTSTTGAAGTVTVATTAAPVTTSSTVPWPTEGWTAGTPEEQGMDSATLAEMIDSITSSDLGVDSVTVIRHGRLVLDAAFYPFPPDRAHIIHSCTKSVVGTLIGIAIDQGLIESVSVPVVEILADAAPDEVDDLEAGMTIENLLTMASGLDCRDSYLYQWVGLREMRSSDDWAAHVLALPMSEPPGTQFEYCNGASYLLSAIITEVTGEPALDYARRVLFDPLGITDVTWAAGPGGINHGWGDMYLRPADMAKFGYLYLRDGEWDGDQIVPAAWVEAATSPKMSARTLSDSYGYQWWVDDDGYVMALGFGGQYVIVDRVHDLVVTFTSGLGTGFGQPELLYKTYIVDSVLADGPLEPDPDAQARLAAAVAGAAEPPPAVSPTTNPLEAQIDGVTYLLDDNSGGFRWFRLDFSDDLLVMALEDVDGPIEVTALRDGRFHESEAWGRPWAWRPDWIADDTLSVEFQIIGGVARGEFTFTFTGDAVRFRYYETVQGTDVRAAGSREASQG